MIVLEFKDYAEVHEAMTMVNEGLLGNLMNRLKDVYKGISGQVNQIIASDDIDNQYDAKTGELVKSVLDEINTISDSKTAKSAFAKFNAMVKDGMYYHQSLKFMEDGMLALMDQIAATKMGTEQASKTVGEKAQAQGTANEPAKATEIVITDELKKRIADFDATYKKAVANLETQIQAKMSELLKKTSSDKNKLFINNRFATTKTILLLIEYNIKKNRLHLENLDALKKEMVAQYSTALNSAKALQTAMSSKQAAGLTLEAYNNLDINGFMKEYPAEQPVSNSADYKNRFVYPYSTLGTGLNLIITGYDLNNQTVAVQVIDANGNVKENKTSAAPIPFKDFKENMLLGSNNIPPVKQKGGSTIKQTPPANQANTEIVSK